MLALTDQQEMQLVAPLGGGAGFFVLSLFWFLATSNLNRYTWKALLACAGLVTYALYFMVWQNEIREVWQWSRLLVIFGILLSAIIPFGLFYWIWRVQVGAKMERAGSRPNGSAPPTDPAPRKTN
jgi:hypothetical protein